MTLAIGFKMEGVSLLLALSLAWPCCDRLSMGLAGALLAALVGLGLTASLAGVVSAPLVYLPALVGAVWGLWRTVELAWQELYPDEGWRDG